MNLKKIAVITSKNGFWYKEYISEDNLRSLAVKFVGDKDPSIERSWSPFQWSRMYQEKMSPGFKETMKQLRVVDDNIRNFASELNYLANVLPKDPTKLADIALILIEIRQRFDNIIEAGKDIKPAQEKKLKDFYGKFHIRIPERLKTNTTANYEYNLVAEAGVVGDFVNWLGRKIYELNDSDTREMKRVVQHLLNTTRSTVDSLNKTLSEMTSARKTGDINKYIENLQFISKEQSDFQKDFDAVYDAYLKEPYEHAIAIEAQAKKNAEARGEEYKETHEQVSFDDDGEIEIAVVEVNDIPETEKMPEIGFAETIMSEDNKETRQIEPETRQVEMTPDTDQQPQTETSPSLKELRKMMPPPLPIPGGVPPTDPQGPASIDLPTRRVQQPQTEKMQSEPSQISEPELSSLKLERNTNVSPPSFFNELSGYAPSSDPRNQVKTLESPVHTLPAPKTELSPVQRAMAKYEEKKFLEKLDRLAKTENKYIVAAFMAKYSEKIEDINPLGAARLLNEALKLTNE